jgi:hypothetical protein
MVIMSGLTMIGTSAFAQADEKEKSKKKKGKKEVATEQKKEEDKFGDLVKKCVKYDGLFTLYRDTVTGKSYMAVREDQLNKEYIYFNHIENAAPGTGYFKGSFGDSKIIRFAKNFEKLDVIQENTDFYFDPNVGAEVMKQNINAAAFTTEAIRRANRLSPLDAARAKQISAGLTAQGLGEAQVSALASQGYETISQQLEPLTKYSGIYEGAAAKPAKSIQSELEEEQFKGLESERRKRLAEQNVRAFQGQSGLTAQSLSMGSTSGII